MTLKRQLLLVSLLVLMLPWAGCEFIRETEQALRASQQQMLAGRARAVADSFARSAEEFPRVAAPGLAAADQLYAHRLDVAPAIDGYFDDWPIEQASLRTLTDGDARVRFVLGEDGQFLYLYVTVSDPTVVYADARSLLPGSRDAHADRIALVSQSPPYLDDEFSVAAEAPGAIVTFLKSAGVTAGEPTVRAYWQDVPGGYQVEMRIPLNLLGTHLGLAVDNVDDAARPGTRMTSFAADSPGPFVRISAELTQIAASHVRQEDLRLVVTDTGGWRIAVAGDLASAANPSGAAPSRWLRFAYGAAVESGKDALLAEPDPQGRERQPLIADALAGTASSDWYRSPASGRAVVAVAAPVVVDDTVIGVVALQQGTDAILSLTNRGLTRLMNVTLIAMLVVVAALLGYASWLSRRIRRLSLAAEQALESDALHTRLPSATAADEIGDLSRRFSDVLRQLGDYNDYLRTLASKLSHELRTPLAIVTSSLENLEHEPLNESSAGYTARARDGADRLRRILAAMSEASRVEELMRNSEFETVDLQTIVETTVRAYRDVYPARGFRYTSMHEPLRVSAAPELLIQMLDKLVDNAVSFSSDGDEIGIRIRADDDHLLLEVKNPGPPLPERMRGQLFDSMISVRPAKDDKHLGLGLYIARLIADGHGGRIDADNTATGVCFTVRLPLSEPRGSAK